MCAVSMVGDDFARRIPKEYPWTVDPSPWVQPQKPPAIPYTLPAPVSREEFDSLKKTVEEMKELLLKAKKHDEETGQPDCHMEEKVALLKKIADMVGVDLSEVFG